MKIAIIGAGISGGVAARILSSEHEITLFESADYAGGHANTFDAHIGGQSYPVDTGFMVFNDRTYPNFVRLLELLQVESQKSDMSFSVRCDRTKVEYQGSSLGGLFAQKSNFIRPEFIRMLRHIMKFNQAATRAASSGELDDGRTVADFLRPLRLGEMFVTHYLVPMASAIWSTRPSEIMGFPAKFLIGFFYNHGLVQLSDRPQWRTIVGGSRTYVDRLLSPIADRVKLNVRVDHVRRVLEGCEVGFADGTRHRFDQVVFATHSDSTLRLLDDAEEDERSLLSAFRYQDNVATLHTDQSVLPKRPKAWASWNYRIDSKGDADSPAAVTYDLSRLQNHTSETPILLSLNMADAIDPATVLKTFNYSHPAFSSDSIAAQQCHGKISGKRRVHFCGAYWGYGFHEDGVNSALAVTRSFGLGLEACTAACTKES